jgi:predicted Zn-dependent protease
MASPAIPGNLKGTFVQVRTLIKKDKDYPEARRILATVPDGELYTPYHVAMAAIAYAENDKPVALAHLDKALSLSPDDVRLLARTGRIRLQNGERQIAEDYANRGLRQNPEKKGDVTALASLLQQLGDYPNAATLLRNGVLQNPNDTKLRRMLAITQLQMGQLEDCERNLNNCLRLDPKNHYSQIMLGEILIAKGEKVRGLAVLRTADNADCPAKLKERLSLDAAECYVDLGEYGAAKDELTRIQASNSPRFNYSWGRIQYQESDYEFALSSLLAASSGIPGTEPDGAKIDPSTLSAADQKSRCEVLIRELSEKLLKLNASNAGVADSNQNAEPALDFGGDDF